MIESLKNIGCSMTKYQTFCVSMVFLLISTIPCNFAWYANIGTKDNTGILQLILPTIAYLLLEHSLVIPANQIGGSRLSIFTLSVMSYLCLGIGTIGYVWWRENKFPNKWQLLGLIITMFGVGIATYNDDHQDICEEDS